MHLQLLLKAEVVKNKQANQTKITEKCIFCHDETETFCQLDESNQTDYFKKE